MAVWVVGSLRQTVVKAKVARGHSPTCFGLCLLLRFESGVVKNCHAHATRMQNHSSKLAAKMTGE